MLHSQHLPGRHRLPALRYVPAVTSLSKVTHAAAVHVMLVTLPVTLPVIMPTIRAFCTIKLCDQMTCVPVVRLF